MKLADLETPRLILDRTVMSDNIARLKDHLSRLRVPLRPHVKTTKSIPVAQALTAGQPGGITVSTLAEADAFAAAGFKDILYAVGIAASKLAHVAQLRRDGIALKIILDSLEALTAVQAYADREGASFEILIEVDCDGHRSGLVANDPQLVAIARAINEHKRTDFLGVMTHAGGAYDCNDRACLEAAAEHERAVLVGVAEHLRSLGLACPIVSVGSTPTAVFSQRLDGVTEVRAGVFAFNDLLMANLGVCSTEQIALSTLATVIAHRRERNWIITDSGWTSLSADQGTRGQKRDYGFGLVCDVDGRPFHDLTVVGVNQEHGIIGRSDGGPVPFDKLRIGTLLRILPIHACATAAAHSDYVVVEGGQSVVGVWPRLQVKH
jgi:D-serine deaminase-like pyridoxal phosphate-dependent protein